jgi:hypothetical protein
MQLRQSHQKIDISHWQKIIVVSKLRRPGSIRSLRNGEIAHRIIGKSQRCKTIDKINDCQHAGNHYPYPAFRTLIVQCILIFSIEYDRRTVTAHDDRL